jgi:hypothetical protein
MLFIAVGLLQMASALPPDNARLLREARAAQSRFEGIRRMHAPVSQVRGSSGECDHRIGRYCYWYDSTDAPPPAEPKRISDARTKLIALLDSAVARDPREGWMLGQLTRYLIEGGRLEEAAARARSCRAEPWWCAALEGLALHAAEQYASADSVFAVALERMTADRRCEWTDLRILVNERLRRELSRATCGDRARLAERLWALSQPLWSTEGNDLRTEHFARLTMAHILERSANGHGMSFGADSRELLLRYGWAERYTREPPGPGLYHVSSMTGHDREPSYVFFPDVSLASRIPRVSPSSWRLRDAAGETRYAPRHLKGASTLQHQLVRFPRGDSMQIAVAFRIADTLLARDSLTAAIGVYRDTMPRMIGTTRGSAIEGRLTDALLAVVPSDTMLVSVEVRGDSSKRLARARYTVDPLPCADAWCVSDLLLFEGASETAVADVALALARALTSEIFSVRRPLGVLWELQGVPGKEPMWMSLTVTPLRARLARRVATRLRLAPGQAPVRLRWQATTDVRAPRSVTLRLPAKARGRHRVTLTLEVPGTSPISATREIELVP